MEIPRRLRQQLPSILKRADTELLEHELWAAKAAIEAWGIFSLATASIREEGLQRGEQLSVAALDASYGWRLVKREHSGAAAWAEKLALHRDGKLFWRHLIGQMRALFDDAIKTSLQEGGLIFWLMRLEERYQEYHSGECFNKDACDEGLRQLNLWFRDAPFSEVIDTESHTHAVIRLQLLRENVNRIIACLMEGRDRAQCMLQGFPDPTAMPHKEASRILLSTIESGNGDSSKVRSQEEACAYDHLREHWADADESSPCRKLLTWFRKAGTVAYFRCPNRNEESRALLDEIRASLSEGHGV